MDNLKNKSYKEYDYVSRYTSFPYYYNTLDDKYVYGITSTIDHSIEYVEHKVTSADTLDNLALAYYGRPDYYWIIADFNDIVDPFIELSSQFKTIKIPSFSSVKFIS